MVSVSGCLVVVLIGDTTDAGGEGYYVDYISSLEEPHRGVTSEVGSELKSKTLIDPW